MSRFLKMQAWFFRAKRWVSRALRLFSMQQQSFAKPQRLAFILLVGLQAACSGIDTHIDAQADFNPADYRHYAWASRPLTDSQNVALLQIDRVVRATVDSELQRQGYTRVENKSDADALFDYRLASHMDVSQPGNSNSPRDDAARAMDLNRNSATDVAIYNHPTLPYIERVELLLSLQAQRSGEMVWQGSAIKTVDDVNPGERFSTADIQRAVTLLLGQLKAPIAK
ncbi:MAG TPA: DUF4136 domain-containing protein [Spongiibacteraceae bacterium]|nr:DUF4136 domain-containing protein [Spongiibacteraceae bacterium]